MIGLNRVWLAALTARRWEFLDPEVPHAQNWVWWVWCLRLDQAAGLPITSNTWSISSHRLGWSLLALSPRPHAAMTPARVSTRQNELVWMDTGVDEVGLSRATLRGKTESGSGVVEVGKVARLLAYSVVSDSPAYARSIDDRGGEPCQKGLLPARGPRAGRSGIWANPCQAQRNTPCALGGSLDLPEATGAAGVSTYQLRSLRPEPPSRGF
jgi:hypothetical protein